METIEKFYLKISKNWKKIKPYVPNFVVESGLNFLFWYSDRKDHKMYIKTGCSKFPPSNLRYRVHGDPFIESFTRIGIDQTKDLNFILAKIDKTISSFHDVLDFGCGCGRTLIQLQENNDCNFFGTDIDKDAIEWCQNNLKFAKFSINQEMPPTKYESSKFDLIYAISVFTHMNEKLQFLWLEELKRITKPKGVVLLTLHNTDLLRLRISKKDDFEKITRTGFVHRKGDFVPKTFPDWYQNAYHSKEYVMKNFSKNFKILNYIPKGMNNLHDVVVLENS